MPASKDFEKQVSGYGLTSAIIWYFLPDHPTIINPNFILWQEYDLFPKFPLLREYLSRWGKDREEDGVCARLSHIYVAHSQLIQPAKVNAVEFLGRLN